MVAQRKRCGANDTIPLLTKLKVRTLFLSQGLSHAEIGKQTGLKTSAVTNLVHREKWTQTKRERAEKLSRAVDARMIAGEAEIIERIAQDAEAHALGGLVRAGEALERNSETSARDFQSYTGGVRNLVQVSRLCRGESDSSQAGATTIFIARFDTAPKVEKLAGTPAIDLEIP